MLENEIEDHPDFPQPVPGEDQLGPPTMPILVHCIHCHEEYDSYEIKWVVRQDEDGKMWPHWACPIPGCDGAGFCFDIWPVDPEWRDENGNKVHFEDDGEYDDKYAEDEEDEFDASSDAELEKQLKADMTAFTSGPVEEYDPEEDVVDDPDAELLRELESYDDDDDWIPDHPGTY